eukprot:CAMPEP_0119089238 /NCGR_PEP_ID=MMETSP1178-20130426/148384_1 /TAXON_ID=33656 /ORGANISM="unid sp, Strain CCMP2000" /LENGTH=42 /DNA_ID= /DNA_START= /DNA_END= /DNA_ORIENTATION=
MPTPGKYTLGGEASSSRSSSTLGSHTPPPSLRRDKHTPPKPP